jgi:hypothetical protein
VLYPLKLVVVVIIGLAYIWQSQTEINANKICKIIREMFNDIERQKVFSNTRKKNSLIFYCEMKRELGKESYVDECTRKERMGIIWLKAGIWKLRGIRRGFGKGRCPNVLGEEDAKHIPLKCLETKKWSEELVCSKQLNINEDIARK